MASLSFIMDVHEDGQTDSRGPPLTLNKRDRGPNKPASAGPPPPYDAPPSNPQPDPRHASTPGPASAEQDINPAVPAAGLTKGGGASLRGSKSSPAVAISGTQEPGAGTRTAASVTVAITPATPSAASTSPTLSASATPRQSSRLRSTTSADSMMDRPRYAPPPSSSSMGLGSLQRPMPLHHPATTQFTPKITPKTGRVSKAKKGLPVHICDACNPPKV